MTDTYTRDGVTWRRQWVGDNSGRYEWTSDEQRLVVFREHREYSATLDGYPSTKSWPTLTGAMAATVKGRDALDRRRAA